MRWLKFHDQTGQALQQSFAAALQQVRQPLVGQVEKARTVWSDAKNLQRPQRLHAPHFPPSRAIAGP